LPKQPEIKVDEWDGLADERLAFAIALLERAISAAQAGKGKLIEATADEPAALLPAYPKQREFHNAGASFRERLLMAGNQVGKTIAGGMEAAYHATGQYPDWWERRRFDKPTVGWVAGVTGESTRDNPQRILLGRVGEHGTGSIPKDGLLDITPARGVPDLVDTVTVKHVSGGVSSIGLKSYEKGREKWQGETLDYVWFDEDRGRTSTAKG
jgi:hypothetical protein